jgi:hypothetical protein
MPIVNLTPNNNNIIISWQDGIVKSLIDNKLRAKSKSVGLQHAMDILGESSSSDSNISQHPSIGEGALDETFNATLPPTINPGNILEPFQPPPGMWNNCSTSKCTSPTKTSASNDRNDQQSVKMMLPQDRTDLKCVAMTNHLNNTGPTRSEQFEQSTTLSVLKTRPTTNVWPANSAMLQITKQILESKSPCPTKPEFCFEMMLEAAEKNFLILKRHSFDLGKAIKAQSANSLVGYGSEFRKHWILSPLLGNHPLWPQMKSFLENSSQWPTEPISEEERIGDVEEALQFENHKRAQSQPELLLKLVTGDVIHGYTICLPLDKIIRIPHVCMAPLNIQAQWMINEFGEIVAKDCLTHDQSFKWKILEQASTLVAILQHCRNACLENSSCG